MPRISGLGLTGKLVLAFAAVAGIGYGGYAFLTAPDEDSLVEHTIVNENGEEETVSIEVAEQRTAGWFHRDSGRTYVIWDGTIFEELNNDHGFTGYRTTYDANIYDFDLGIIYHPTNGESGITSTTFNELVIGGERLPAHLYHVRDIGCDLAQDYIERAERPEYSDPPADVAAFHERHCVDPKQGLDLIP